MPQSTNGHSVNPGKTSIVRGFNNPEDLKSTRPPVITREVFFDLPE